MKPYIKLILGIVAAAAFIVLLDSLFIVPQIQQAIVIQFGEPKRVIQEPGLHAKVPFIQRVILYDNRLLGLDPPAKEVLLSDKKRIVVDAFLRFRIINPLLFYQALQTEEMAHSRLSDATVSSLRDVLGKFDMKTILSPKRSEIMDQIRDEVDSKAKAFGVEVVDVRIRRADLPDETSQAVYARMRSEREREAKEFRAQGQQMNQKIKAEADRDKIRILAQAQKDAQVLRGQGDKEAANIWAKASRRDKDFYAFYRSLEAYKNSIKTDGTSLVISPDSEFFKFFSTLPTGAKR
ncbi:MAG: protease modulator HflC [Alphaproteobacteria bacterium]|nr:protease modulator HflC [Alphaproteobacteria bacterium]